MTAIFEKLAFYWTYPFVRYALIVGVLIALCSSLLGGKAGEICVMPRPRTGTLHPS